jgi:membrane associated rhomboid family serine protease
MVPGEITGRAPVGLAVPVGPGAACPAVQILVDPASPVPMVGASGAISGVLGAYLVLYPRVRVNLLVILFIFVRIIPVPAWVMLFWWIGVQVLSALPQLASPGAEHVGVAFWAHIGGFLAGVVLVKPFENRRLVEARTRFAQW